MEAFFQWIDTHAWSTALHESLMVYPLVESTHVMALMLFAGTITMVDLRLLGAAFQSVPISEMTRRTLPWTIAGGLILLITGLLLVYAIPVRTYHSIWFRIKVIFLVIAAINIFIFHFRVQRDQAQWDNAERPPFPARLSAAISLAMWTGIIVTGRLIAYNWYDCDKPQSGFVTWFAGCTPIEGF